MTLVEGQELERRVAPREDDQRGVGKPDPELAMLPDDRSRLVEIALVEGRVQIGAADEIAQQPQLGLDAEELGDQVIELREDERREDERSRQLTQDGCA